MVHIKKIVISSQTGKDGTIITDLDTLFFIICYYLFLYICICFNCLYFTLLSCETRSVEFHCLRIFVLGPSSCSRKNFVFLFGALINLTVRVDAYFHLIRMTYSIHPGPFFPAAPNWGKPAKHSLSSSELFKKDRRLTVRSSIAAASTQWGKPANLWTPCVYSLRPRVPSWIWIRWIQSASHGNNSKSPSTLAMLTATQNTAPTDSHFIPGQHFLEVFTLLSPNDQDHASFQDYIIPVLNQKTRPLLHLWRQFATHTFSNALT